jgi:integrase/recombinase XerD
VGDIDFENMSIKLKSTPKRSNRILYFDNETEYVLRAWLQFRKGKERNPTPALFLSREGVRISSESIGTLVEKHASRVGLHNPESKRLEDRFSPHCCRHWFTTHLIRAGMQRDFVKELRGDVRHEAIDIYNHIDKMELRESYLAHIPQLGI